MLFAATGCYTKVATNDGDHWGYTGPVKKKVVVRETDDTIVIRETRVIHQPQPIVTDTITYSNTTSGQENVVVNNYYNTPNYGYAAPTPWSNYDRNWYDDYWYRPGVSFSISIGHDHHHQHASWWNRHWRRQAYYQSWWDYDYYRPFENWHHASYRGPGWVAYDPYYPYPPMYSYGYGCYAPVYDPYAYWPYYGHGYNGGGYYGNHHGHGHHDDYDYDDDDNNDGRDRNGRERRGGRVGGEDRRGGVTTDNGGGNSSDIVKKEEIVNVRDLGNASTDHAPVGSAVNSRTPADAVATTRGAATTIGNTSGSTDIGNVRISTGEIPVGDRSGNDRMNVSTTGSTPVARTSTSPNSSDRAAVRTSSSQSVTKTGGAQSAPAASSIGQSTTQSVPTARTPAQSTVKGDSKPVEIVKPTREERTPTRSVQDNDSRAGSRGSSSNVAPPSRGGSSSSGSNATSSNGSSSGSSRSGGSSSGSSSSGSSGSGSSRSDDGDSGSRRSGSRR